MILTHMLPLPGTLVYLVGVMVAWRMIAGHFAWSIHRAAATNKTLRPPVENWVGCAIISLPLALIWFIVLFFAIPWPSHLRRGAEAQGEDLVRGVTYAQIEKANLEAERHLGLGEGEVVGPNGVT